MSDPVFGGAASKLAASLAAAAVQAVARKVTSSAWEEADELGRLFWLMDALFGDELPAITRPELEHTWRGSPEFVEVYERLSDAGKGPHLV